MRELKTARDNNQHIYSFLADFLGLTVLDLISEPAKWSFFLFPECSYSLSLISYPLPHIIPWLTLLIFQVWAYMSVSSSRKHALTAPRSG